MTMPAITMRFVTTSAVGMLLIAVAVAVAVAVAAGAAQPPAEVTADSSYAESAALVAVSPDGSTEVSVRIARFPGQGKGTLWLALFRGEERYGVVIEDMSLGAFTGRTPVGDPTARFAVEGPARAELECRERDSTAMRCTARVEAMAHQTFDPPLGAGSQPITVEAEFVASHRGAPARGLIEVFGSVKATLTTPRGTTRLEAPAKWHEQTGERPRFAGAFTYLAIEGEGAALLARTGGGTTWGFAVIDGRTIDVASFSIPAVDAPRRRFRVELADGRVIEGEPVVVRRTSVPIEGQRRPGATVRVETELGMMVGHLNDWKPAP